MKYLVDVGQLIEVRAATPHDAAMLALFARDGGNPLPPLIDVYGAPTRYPSLITPAFQFTLDALPCRLCGCTEQRACRGGCAWAVPGICTRCFIPPAPHSPSYALET